MRALERTILIFEGRHQCHRNLTKLRWLDFFGMDPQFVVWYPTKKEQR